MKKYDYNNENLETNDSTVNEPAVAYVGTRYTVHGTGWDESEMVGDNASRRDAMHCVSTTTDRDGGMDYAEFQQHRTKLFGKNIEHLCFDTQNFKFNRNEANER